ncbi:DUF2256 domain-containing protein [Vibrio mediterranei]|uniref:DUF2256 domain-containing protein n=1 Tax=Vibrio mediterranei TaxID=689 RepID=A0A3G4VKY6_9VIBR|nr:MULTISPECIES: DUF2256 domain-containing protein [Vibrio]AYV24879.1 DUF2256 domain-containing protein [Vibrio mediterranei]EDL54580.1 hypothetical protein VSAK1_20524 [Vibrio mediterranei AK1]MCF4172202.1 DUF2256 domain-containing protein [Vibrio sp. McD22-P3]MCG9789920.1 DUF2256 domain-containing protein [Vibrio mediterranei]MCY9852025.1 DUF2256 domain-containing protein [Vibrio mediterranei]
MHRKSHLPRKICGHCDKPFTWRKKWQRCWEQVRYCSKRCSSKARGAKKTSEC